MAKSRWKWTVLGLTCFSLACNHRAPVPGDHDGGASHAEQDQGQATYGDILLLPDGAIRDGYVPYICQQEQVKVALYNDPRGNFTLALPQGYVAQAVGIKSASQVESAVAFNREQVAALAATIQASGSPATMQDGIRQQLTDDLAALNKGYVTVRSSGSIGLSYDNHPDVKEATWLVTTYSPADCGELRDQVLASVLGRPRAELSGLPTATVGMPSTSLLVKLTLVRRPDRTYVTAAVTEQAGYDTLASTTFALMDDMSNGSSLAPTGQGTRFECDIAKITGKPKADIIWVVDESGSMNDNRQDIVNNANDFFQRAKASGLDFRMGVTGVKQPIGNSIMGKFCSESSYNSGHDGGDDRFLLPQEKDIFSACVQNPPFYEGGSEYGLTNAYHAVTRHLPRSVSAVGKIRTDAKLALIIATDEAPQELKSGGSFMGKGGFLTYSDYKFDACVLSQPKKAQLDEFLNPLVDLFSGISDPQSAATVHLITGLCQNSCKADMAHGYRELTNLLGGQIGDVCQKSLGPTLQIIINSIIASASPRRLAYRPISSTLVVEAQTVRLKRSRLQGFSYSAASNTLTFNGVKVLPGHQIAAAYRRFVSGK